MRHSSLMKVAGVGALALTLAPCAGGGTPAPAETESTAPQGGGEPLIWMDENRASALEDVVATFEEETGTIRDDLTTQAPSGDGPDVVVGAHDWIGKLVQNGVIAPVELGELAGEFEDVAIQAMSYDGSVYGVPVSIENTPGAPRSTRCSSASTRTTPTRTTCTRCRHRSAARSSA